MRTRTNVLRFLVLPAGLFLCAILSINVLSFNYEDKLPEGTYEVQQVHHIANNGLQTLTESGYGSVVELPHSWNTDFEHHVGWYTALVPVRDLPSRPQAIYFPDISVDTTVYLNDQILGSVLRPNETRGRMGRRPLLLRVPVGLWVRGDNEVNIRVNAQPNSMEWLNRFYVGTESDLSDVYSMHVFRSVSMVKIIALMLAFTALGMGVVWLYRPRDAAYGWYAIVCTAWSGVTMAEISDAVFLDYELPAWVGTVLFFVLCIAVFKFVDEGHEGNGLKRKQASWVVAALVLVSVMLLLWKHQPAVYLLVTGLGICVLLYACLMAVVSTVRVQTFDIAILCLTVFMLTLLASESWMEAWSTPGLAFSGLSTAIAAPAFVFLIGYQLVRDFVNARNELEVLNSSLEQRVAQRTDALRKKHKQLLLLEKNEVLASERDRIMLEMHDGMGAHLVSILSMTDAEKVDVKRLKSSVKDALQDLRMMIDSMDPVENDLGLVLGMYRQRICSTLKESSVKLHWDVVDFPVMSDLTPHRVLQVLRIVQEAVTNSLKYSGSETIRISNGVEEGHPYILVQDFGLGMKGDCINKGRGLRNMQKRAITIGADVRIQSDGSGVTVKLLLPQMCEQYQIA